MDYSPPSALSARKNKRRGRGFLRGLWNPVRSCSGRSPSPAAAAPPPARRVDIRNGNNNLAAVKRENVAGGDHDDAAAAALPGGAVDDEDDEEVDRRAEKLIASFREKIRAPSSSK
ncbi:unnamed protein product [Cuscuta campestris]|uniref:Uncharacterized protein n=1 Tax=Cuscuta campestris TaxID=132261 RepID=A0A484M4M9_9ASTE|nr:unnamed protein product [Cuscuta campestris]